MKKEIFTILLLLLALSSVKANKYECQLVIANGDSSFVYVKDYYNTKWVYPLYEYPTG